MTSPREPIAAFAKRVVALERDAAPGDVRGVAERVVAKLHTGLGRLVGTAGFDALLNRSLVIARRDAPLLAGVRSAAGGRIEGFREALAAQDDAAAIGAAETLVAHFVELLVVLIGVKLGMQLVRAIWPPEEPSPTHRKKGTR